MADLRVARSELILGGPGSGKTRRAEDLASAWLSQDAAHRAIYIATAQAWDDEMRERIARRRMDRALRVPGMETVEEANELAHAIGTHSRADTLIVVDCLTLALTARLMPAADIANAISGCAGPIVLISNEIGEGAVPPGSDGRNFVDALGTLNQEAAEACERVTLMSEGLALTLKGAR